MYDQYTSEYNLLLKKETSDEVELKKAEYIKQFKMLCESIPEDKMWGGPLDHVFSSGITSLNVKTHECYNLTDHLCFTMTVKL